MAGHLRSRVYVLGSTGLLEGGAFICALKSRVYCLGSTDLFRGLDAQLIDDSLSHVGRLYVLVIIPKIVEPILRHKIAAIDQSM